VTAFTDLVGCRLPLQQAGMGGVTTPALAAAVADAGGLGTLAVAGLTAEQALAEVAATGDAAPIGVNFLVPFLEPSVVEAVAPEARVVECFYGSPRADVVERIHQGGALAAWQVGSIDEALAAVDAGCDLVVVQGDEAGGHVRGVEPLLSVLEEAVARLFVPVVAAGGIANATDVAAVLDVGADAVRIGTRFLAADEADVHPAYLSALVEADGDDTMLTVAFSMMWPDAPHRVLRSCVDASDADPATRSLLPPGRDFTDDVGSAALYAGTSVSEVRGGSSAAEIVAELFPS
jgi:NAD(P)H-dependent flavin oxidoreductase YrpB (nitropropane dioxygenase family)